VTGPKRSGFKAVSAKALTAFCFSCPFRQPGRASFSLSS
jgi:hypothetical protein